MPSPFIDFMQQLIIPTLLNLTVSYLLIYFIYRDTLNEPIEEAVLVPINNHRTVMLVKISLAMMFLLIITKIVMDSLHAPIHMNFSYIALLSAFPILFSNQLWILIKKLDWGNLNLFCKHFHSHTKRLG